CRIRRRPAGMDRQHAREETMRRKQLAVVGALMINFAGGWSPAHAAVACDWLAGGSYRAEATAPAKARALAYGQWFCDQGFDTAAAARHFGGDEADEKWFAELARSLDGERGDWRRA